MADKKTPDKKTPEDLQKMILEIMFQMRSHFSEAPEYKTIMMNLTTVSKEINNIRVKEIYPGDEN